MSLDVILQWTFAVLMLLGIVIFFKFGKVVGLYYYLFFALAFIGYLGMLISGELTPFFCVAGIYIMLVGFTYFKRKLDKTQEEIEKIRKGE